MTMEQLTLDLEAATCKALDCPHRRYVGAISRVWCRRGGFYTQCGLPFCGELAQCAYEPIDNSKEACERRLRWLQDHKGEAMHDI